MINIKKQRNFITTIESFSSIFSLIHSKILIFCVILLPSKINFLEYELTFHDVSYFIPIGIIGEILLVAITISKS